MKRPFRGLREREPQERYDAVVIGAGIGGLFCANLLAKAGLSVLMVEQHYMVGGYCSTFRRKGYTFDAATHFYPLLGNPTTITGKLLVDLGVQTGWGKMDPVDTIHFQSSWPPWYTYIRCSERSITIRLPPPAAGSGVEPWVEPAGIRSF